ncbi:MAG: type II secretion system inner membrane protein GspF [Polyangiaceae bacterium]|nr:type II secretion system inner membrane protein GspF [Polyangiaceae bacterium]
MAVFEYRGVEAQSGNAAKGYRDADNLKALRALLRKDGILLTSATEGDEKKVGVQREIDFFSVFHRVTSGDIAIMTRQLATLVKAGVPLIDSISALVEQVEKEALVKILTAVRETLNEGTSFAKSLEAHPKAFPPLYTNMVAAGEASGTLDAVLSRLADFMEGQAQLKTKIVSALAYPVMMGVVGSAIVTLLMVVIVPKVTAMFDSMDQVLPWYTQLLIFISSVVANAWWAIALLIAGGIYGFRRWRSTPEGLLQWHRFVLRLPLFGRLSLLTAVVRFARTLATLLGSGVPLLPAMGIVKNVLGNAELELVVQDAIGSIREGESIAEPLKRSGRFPPMVTHMITVGERTGQLEEMLDNVSRAYESEVDASVTTLTSLLEPAVIVIMGGAVAFIAMSILMPLVQMNDMVQ